MSDQPTSAPSGFTDAERQAWLEERRALQGRSKSTMTDAPAALCVHCGNTVGYAGSITDEAALCVVCLGD